jgi:tetratricopeptide (TPR) repeat protein
MGETTIQPANQATGHPASEPTDHPPKKKKKKKKKRHVATWIALASAATALVAAAISGLQVNLAGKQNTVAEQQQLVNLTSLIGQQFAQQGTSTTGTLKGLAGTQAAANATQAEVAQLTVEGQAAAVLIRGLNGDGVAGIEYVDVARALYFSGDTTDAITYYSDAQNAPPYDATTHALALRYLGGVYYQLGQKAVAHRDYMRATKVFSRHSLQTRNYIANAIAQAYLADAGYQILIKGCHIAAADMVAAHRAMGSYTEGAVDLSLQAVDTKAYPLQCASAG